MNIEKIGEEMITNRLAIFLGLKYQETKVWMLVLLCMIITGLAIYFCYISPYTILVFIPIYLGFCLLVGIYGFAMIYGLIVLCKWLKENWIKAGEISRENKYMNNKKDIQSITNG